MKSIHVFSAGGLPVKGTNSVPGTLEAEDFDDGANDSFTIKKAMK